jgi:hypothetical protein
VRKGDRLWQLGFGGGALPSLLNWLRPPAASYCLLACKEANPQLPTPQQASAAYALCEQWRELAACCAVCAGFKCNSAVWSALRDIRQRHPAWA